MNGHGVIDERPRDYDLEHEGDDEDVAFYLKLLDRWRPRRVMELASGSGRVAIPLARAAAALQIEIVGLEREGPMLEEARRKAAALDDGERAGLSFLAADRAMGAWPIRSTSSSLPVRHSLTCSRSTSNLPRGDASTTT